MLGAHGASAACCRVKATKKKKTFPFYFVRVAFFACLFSLFNLPFWYFTSCSYIGNFVAAFYSVAFNVKMNENHFISQLLNFLCHFFLSSSSSLSLLLFPGIPQFVNQNYFIFAFALINAKRQAFSRAQHEHTDKTKFWALLVFQHEFAIKLSFDCINFSSFALKFELYSPEYWWTAQMRFGRDANFSV